MIDDDGRLLGQALDALDDVFYVYDEQERLMAWNDRLDELCGLTDDQLAGTTPDDFFPEAERPAVERAVEGIFETGETVVEARAETVRSVVRFELTGRLLTEDGTAIGFCGTGRDATDRRDIDVADVYRALTYYHDNPEEMRAVERRRETAVEDHEHLTTDPDGVRD